MLAIYDNFNYTQSIGTIGYQGTSYWAPNSSRTVAGYSNTSINNTVLGHFFVNNATLNYVTYTYNTPVDFSNVSSLTFTDTYLSSTGSVLFNIYLNGVKVVNNYIANLTPTGSTFVIPLSVSSYTSVTSLEIRSAPETPGATVSIGPFFATITCVAHGSLILTPLGYKPVQDLQREEEIIGGKIARIIKTQLHPEQGVESVFLPASCIEKNLPERDIIVCSEHYLVYKGKRRLAKCFLAYPGVKVEIGRVKDLLPGDKEGNYYFYDIQFDHEGEYIVNGMISQSRSPYASVSPLPKELYFEEKNYKEERVGNTLSPLPPIVTKYLLPNGEEVEDFYKIVLK